MSRIFISYRQSEAAHCERVRSFAEQLKQRRVSVVLDQFYTEINPGGPDDGWAKWCSDCVSKADKIIIIGCASWFRCFEGEEQVSGQGAIWEAREIRQRLYEKGAKPNNDIRVVLFDGSNAGRIPSILRAYRHFNADDDFDDIIDWLGGETSPAASFRPIQGTINWPSRGAFEPDLADRCEIFDFFADSLSNSAARRATLVCASSGHGKTRLIGQFFKYGCEVMGADACCLVDFKNGKPTNYLLDVISSDVGHLLPSFKFHKTPSSLRDDLRNLKQPLLFVFDTFEQAPPDTQQFVEDHFLADLGRFPAVRILLGGQQSGFPKPGAALWGDHAGTFNLDPILDTAPWVAWAAKRFPSLPPQVVGTVVAGAAGVPATIVQFLATLGSLPPDKIRELGC